MPTPLAHLAVPLVARVLLGAHRLRGSLLAAGCFAAVLPDADVLLYWFDIGDESRWGHRGFTHSITFALLLAVCGWLAWRRRESRRLAFAFVLACAASHGVLDAFTHGGADVGFLSPWSANRWSARVQPIQAATIHPKRLFSPRGLAIVRTELTWIWLPALAIGGLAVWRRRREQPAPP